MPVTIELSDADVELVREAYGNTAGRFSLVLHRRVVRTIQAAINNARRAARLPDPNYVQPYHNVGSTLDDWPGNSHLCPQGCGTWLSADGLDANDTVHANCSQPNHDDGTPYPDNGTDRDRNVVG